MDSSWIFGSALMLLAVFFLLSVKTNKTKKLRIFLADNTSIEVTRKWNDSWNDTKDMRCYHQGDKTIWLANHWVIRTEVM
jgi:hypothetical protein